MARTSYMLIEPCTPLMGPSWYRIFHTSLWFKFKLSSLLLNLQYVRISLHQLFLSSKWYYYRKERQLSQFGSYMGYIWAMSLCKSGLHDNSDINFPNNCQFHLFKFQYTYNTETRVNMLICIIWANEAIGIGNQATDFSKMSPNTPHTLCKSFLGCCSPAHPFELNKAKLWTKSWLFQVFTLHTDLT